MPGDPAADDPGWFLFEGAPHVLDFDLTLEKDAVNALKRDPRTDAHATFTFEGESWDVGVHLKGSMTFRNLDAKASFKLDFHQWDPEGSFRGVRRLVLDNMLQDTSMVGADSSYWFARRIGLPAPRHTWARLRVNGEPWGLYGVTEAVDEQFLKREFTSNDGNLYEGGYGADVKRGSAGRFDVDEAGDLVAAPDDLQDLIDAITATDETTYYRELGLHFDVDALLREFATEIVVGNGDSYITWANNFTLYDDIDGGQWTLIQLGPDQAFTSHSNPRKNFAGALAKRCRESIPCSQALDAQITEVVNAADQVDLLGRVRETWALVHDDCVADPRKELPCKDLDRLEKYIPERLEEIREDLAEPPK